MVLSPFDSQTRVLQVSPLAPLHELGTTGRGFRRQHRQWPPRSIDQDSEIRFPASMSIRRARDTVRSWPGVSWAASVRRNRLASQRAGERVRLRRTSDGWLREYAGGVIPPGVKKSPSTLERETLEYFCTDYVPRPGDTVLDVGAGVGSEVLTFSRLVGTTGRVFSIEAHPDAFRVLCRLVEVNELRNVVPIHAAVSDRPGTVGITTIAENIDSHSTVNSVVNGREQILVEAQTLDDIVNEHEIARIDFLKMNIEGAEGPALRAADKTMVITRNLAISCHDFVAEDGRGGDEMRTMAEVWSYLARQGFKLRTRADDPRPFIRSYVLGHREE